MDDDMEKFMASVESIEEEKPPEIDPLDEFMAKLEKETKIPPKKAKPKKRRERLNLDEDDETPKNLRKLPPRNYPKIELNRDRADYNSDEEVYATAKAIDRLERERSKVGGKVQYDASGNPILMSKNDKTIGCLKPVDHSKIQYSNYVKNIYSEKDEVRCVSPEERDKTRSEQGIDIVGKDVPNLCKGFKQFGINLDVSRILVEKFVSPSSVQSQAVPCILSGKDTLAIAQTGSGKTLAYIIPLLEKLSRMNLQPNHLGNGPLAVVVAPTHELSKQICEESALYAKKYRVRILALYGGMNYYAQGLALKKGVDLIVGTPGRMINLVLKKMLNFNRVCFFVLDEADRMLEMGFKQQVLSISSQIRPDRQTMMFSATFPNEMKYLTNSLLTDHIQIIVGKLKAANKNIRQVVEVFSSKNLKISWLMRKILSFVKFGRVLIFVSTIKNCEELSQILKSVGVLNGVIHGNYDQRKREEILKKFKDNKCKVLVATDVAARGLHIGGLNTVINFDAPKNIETHINRVGRTGRAGENGIAYTLLTKENRSEAIFIRMNLVQSLQPLTKALNDLIIFNNTEASPQNTYLSQTLSNNGQMKSAINYTNKNFAKRKTRPRIGAIPFGGGVSEAKRRFKNSFVSSNSAVKDDLDTKATVSYRNKYGERVTKVLEKNKRSRWGPKRK